MRETSGWSPGWDGSLPATQAELIVQVSTFCDDNFGGQGYPTWSDEPAGADESLPMNCLSWFLAFAFCAWDGGRLPTEAEWHYAAAGGDEQRTYPWGEEALDPSRAVFACTGDGSAPGECAPSDIGRAGSRSPNGDGRWGQADLAGNTFEWTLDADAPYSADPCVDCAAIDASTVRVMRGGAWFVVNPGDEVYLQANARYQLGQTSVLPDIGVRCARNP
jgi:formylglycine-generating enzyme required for sulfatase activity